MKFGWFHGSNVGRESYMYNNININNYLYSLHACVIGYSPPIKAFIIRKYKIFCNRYLIGKKLFVQEHFLNMTEMYKI